MFSEIFYPHGWTATIDGKKTPIARADYVLRALYIPAGEHEVVMAFRPTSIRITETIAWCGMGLFAVIVAGAAVITCRRKRKE